MSSATLGSTESEMRGSVARNPCIKHTVPAPGPTYTLGKLRQVTYPYVSVFVITHNMEIMEYRYTVNR